MSGLHSTTGITFYNNGDDQPYIVEMSVKYDLDCTGDKPKQNFKDTTLLVNMVQCIPIDSKSMAGNPYTIMLGLCTV